MIVTIIVTRAKSVYSKDGLVSAQTDGARRLSERESMQDDLSWVGYETLTQNHPTRQLSPTLDVGEIYHEPGKPIRGFWEKWRCTGRDLNKRRGRSN